MYELFLVKLLIILQFKMNNTQKLDVIIIGAGISGIGAARTLHDSGNQGLKANYLVLESRESIGGRIQKLTFQGVDIDIGAYQIPSYNEHNKLFQYGQQLNWKFFNPKNKAVLHYDAKDGLISQNQYLKVRGIQSRLIDQLIHSNRTGQNNGLTLVQAIEKTNAYQEEVLQLKQRERNLFKLFMGLIQQEYGASVSELGTIAVDPTLHETFQTDQYPIPNSYRSLLLNIAESEHYSKLNVKFNRRVTKIIQKTELNSIQIIVENLLNKKIEKYECDYVICAIPLSQIRAKKIKFVPELPVKYTQCFGKIGIGFMNKVLLSFEERFWPEDTLRFKISSEQSGKYPHFFNASFNQTDKNILVGFMAAKYAQQNFDNTEDQIKYQIQSLLSKTFKKTVIAKDIFITRWENEKFIEMSYSFETPSTKPQVFEILRTPIDERLWFAGQYMYEPNIGCAHGAFTTGINSATHILKFIKEKSKNLIPLQNLTLA